MTTFQIPELDTKRSTDTDPEAVQAYADELRTLFIGYVYDNVADREIRSNILTLARHYAHVSGNAEWRDGWNRGYGHTREEVRS